MTSPQKRIAITGAHGFIGAALVTHFRTLGYDVLPISRTAKSGELDFDLEQPQLNDDALVGVDVLIHAGYVKATASKKALAANLNGTKYLLHQAQAAGVGQFIFLSSLSAHPDAESVYGKQKFQLAEWILKQGGTVVRPGLVLGHGGLFEAMQVQLKKSSRLPIFRDGKQPIQTVHIDDLVKAIHAIADKNMQGSFVVAEDVPVAYDLFYQTLCQHFGTTARFMKMPLGLMLAAVRVFEFIGLRLPVSSDTLLGLKHMKRVASRDDLEKIGVQVRDWKTSINSL